MKAAEVILSLGAGALLLAAPACGKRAPGGSAAPATTATAALPKRWTDLRLPTAGMHRTLPRADEHGYYAEYDGTDANALWEKVSAALRSAGYLPACNALDGAVRGFSNGSEKLAAKIDSIAGRLTLSIFDDKGSEPLLHGVCFGKYKLGPAETVPPGALR